MTGDRRWKRRWAIRLITHAAKVMPDSRSEWSAALTNELDSIASDHAAFRWAIGAVTTCYRERTAIVGIAMTRILAAVCLGVIHASVAGAIWGYLAAGNNPIAYSLIPRLRANGHATAFWLAIGIHDVIVNILIAFPFAALLFVLPRMNRWKYAAVAGVAPVVYGYWGVIWSGNFFLAQYLQFWMGLAMVLLSLPVAFAAMRVVAPSPRSN